MTIALFDCRVDDVAARALDPLWRSGRLASGPAVPALEQRLGAYVGDRAVAAMSDMTQALAMALRLAGVGAGDEVITLAMNCMSSNSAIALVGATPVWVDVDPDTGSIDIADLAACFTERIRAVVVYHLAGYIGDLDAVRSLCDAAGVPLIEDANAALGAEWRGRRAGTIGDFAVFSFYANRQVNGIEGAALVCAREEDAARVRILRRFGIDTARFRTPDGEIDPALDVAEIGVASSLTNVNATLADHAMNDLDARLARNRSNVERLSAELADVPGLRFVAELQGARGVFWVALVRSTTRDRLMTGLKSAGIQCSRLHQRNDVYTGFHANRRNLPGTTMLEKEMLALPCGWWLSHDELDRIVAAVRQSAQRT
ncbi:DegT/DnrJ/EryC1/StrS family aminotransferase [Sphingomonas sp. TX0543]|uniref:DegT/DnrJ/EryC1/StrS family aminotransferase n=1 Tax=unclassified Sphingomonas TaxID=196159 RepID=UPI0010F582F1|nr:DegT/DnrJ/EryC1/StrS family aminotransferase [Sphingomonas sp. 3P27F8]